MEAYLKGLDITIAVSGLKTGDNPQPGVPVIRSIRNAGFTGKIIGLVYDAMESGIYCHDLVDEVYQMPYPSTGVDSFMARLDYILSNSKIDVIIPTLDSEVMLYIRMEDELRSRGIHTFLPTEDQFLLRDKIKLSQYFPPRGVDIPQTFVVQDIAQIMELKDRIDFPIIIKGKLYEAYKAHNFDEAFKFFYELESKWGLPIIIQRIVVGDEFNIVLIGDGKGGICGMVPQRKLVITDKGKGFGGVVVSNPGLDAFAVKVISELKWQGPCELELIKGIDGKYYLLEINPRFPAWVRLAEGAGQNLPAITVLLALGKDFDPLPAYRAGTLFIRHAEDIVSDVSILGEISVKGELVINKEVKK